jgi:hypothetical protein
MNILFVGNSYTYYSDMPEALFAPLAKRAGLDCTVTSVTVGGCTLARYVDEADSAGEKLRAAIAGQHYDLVVLQEHGLQPVKKPAIFEKSVAALLDLLTPQAQRFLLYATPGRKEGHADLLTLDMTSDELTEKLACAYDAVGKKYGLPVAQVGRAFVDYAAAHGEAELYDGDLLHPSLLGSTLAAEVILREILRLK